MAKTTTKKRETASSRSAAKPKVKKSPSVPSHRKRELLGLLLMTLASLWALAILSYNAADDVMARQFTWELLTSPELDLSNNFLGLTGAWIAHLMVPRFLGYPIISITLILISTGYELFRNRNPRRLTSFTVLVLSATLWISCFIAWWAIALDLSLFSWTGDVGMGVTTFLRNIVGIPGSFIILTLMGVSVLLLAIDHDIQSVLDRIENVLARVFGGTFGFISGWKASRDQRKAIKAEKKAFLKSEEARFAQKNGRALNADDSGTPAEILNNTDGRQQDRQNDAGFGDQPLQQLPDETLDKIVGRHPSRQFEQPVARAQKKTPVEAEPGLTITKQIEEESADLDKRKGAKGSMVAKYRLPPVNILNEQEIGSLTIDENEINENKRILLEKLAVYKIEILRINAVVGPTVTRYELTPDASVKISRVKSLEDDLAMAMSAQGIRMIAPIPGKSAIGVEIPNRHRQMVRIRSMLNTTKFRDTKMALPVPIGKTIEGEVYLLDLAKCPHLLIAGATGSGKSVGLNVLIAGLLYSMHPRDLKFVMIDPKKIELNLYTNIARHFIAMPENAKDAIVTDVDQALGTLKSCLKEMEDRYELLSQAMVRGIEQYNQRYAAGKLDKSLGHKHLPYIVIIVDELADLMMTAGKEIEAPIARLAQMARAVGIHLVLATQRPSVDVITGLIKANFPARIAYQVASQIDSRTILDQKGAQGLVGNGDMLYMHGSTLIRLQSPFISIDEVEALTTFIGKQDVVYPYILPALDDENSQIKDQGKLFDTKRDEYFMDAAKIIVRHQQGSVSLLQRRLSVGYTRAARLVDQLEDAGVVGPFEGSKARVVYIIDEEALKAHLAGESKPEN